MNVAQVNVMGLITVYMTNAGDMTVADVKKWLDKVDELGIPDDTRLDNATLKISYRAPHVQKIECGECAPQSSHIGFVAFSTDCDHGKNQEK